jgi:hypothetical protein
VLVGVNVGVGVGVEVTVGVGVGVGHIVTNKTSGKVGFVSTVITSIPLE